MSRDYLMEKVIKFSTLKQQTGEVPVLFVTSPSKAIDVAHKLAAAGLTIASDYSNARTASILRATDSRIPLIRRVSASTSPEKLANHVLLWPLRLRTKLQNFACKTAPALVSGLAEQPNASNLYAVEKTFLWSNFPGTKELSRYIRESGARRVFFTMRDDPPSGVAGKSVEVSALGPPVQMTLF